MKLERGQKVQCNGFEGSIIREYVEDMYEIRMPRGEVCVDVSELDIKLDDVCILAAYRI